MKNREKIACKFRLRTSTYILLHNTVYILKSFCVFFFIKMTNLVKTTTTTTTYFPQGTDNCSQIIQN